MKTTLYWNTKAGLTACQIVSGAGHRCGYVKVPDGHPLHGVEYSDESACLREMANAAVGGPVGSRGVFTVLRMAVRGVRATPEQVFDVHGSITFSGPLKEVGGWWFGFDCAHHGDSPEVQNEAFVEAECERLAAQIAAVKP